MVILPQGYLYPYGVSFIYLVLLKGSFRIFK